MTAKLITTFALSLFGSITFAQFAIFSKYTLNGEKFGVVKNNDTVIKPSYDKIKYLNTKVFQVTLNKLIGFVDTNGTLKTSPKYTQVTAFIEERAFATTDGSKYKIIDKYGVIKGTSIFDNYSDFSSGMAAVWVGEKMYYSDKNGILLKFTDFEKGSYFFLGYARVKKLGYNRPDLGSDVKYYLEGLIDLTGKLVIPYNTGKLDDFATYHTTIEQKLNDSIYVVDYDNTNSSPIEVWNENGKIISTSQIISSIQKFYNYFIINNGTGYGIIDKKGNILYPCNFYGVSDYVYNENKYARILFNESTYFYVDRNMKCQEFEGITCPN